MEDNPLSILLALVAERFGWVKVEGITCEIEIPGREVDCLVTDNPPGAMVTAIKVKGCSRPSETPLQQLSDDIYANRRYPGYIPKEAQINLVLAFFRLICGKTLHYMPKMPGLAKHDNHRT